MLEEVRLKKLRSGHIVLPRRATEGSAGYDLRVAESVELFYKNPPVLVGTGLAIEIPAGWEGQLRLRGSAALKGVVLLNAPGTIDSDYRGEIMLILTKVTPSPRAIFERGERIAQLVFSQIGLPRLCWAESLSQTVREEGRLGSTGK